MFYDKISSIIISNSSNNVLCNCTRSERYSIKIQCRTLYLYSYHSSVTVVVAVLSVIKHLYNTNLQNDLNPLCITYDNMSKKV